jgi:hypothetical protein
MRISRVYRFLLLLVLLGSVAHAQSALAANYPLEMTAPRNDLPAGHRMLKAYPGLAYNVRAAVVGGAYPFSFTLSNAPSGMTINSQTGEINWPNPVASASPTITVRDAEGTQVSMTWTITVSTSGFKFVNASASAGGNGSITSPWRSLLDVYNSGSGGDIVYFRSGTYDTNGIPTTSSGLELRVEFDQMDGQPVRWVAYPGEQPVIDHR